MQIFVEIALVPERGVEETACSQIVCKMNALPLETRELHN